MIFSSLSFLFVFLPIFLILYYVIGPKYRNCLLFIGSLVFYGVGEPKYIILMLFSILFNYVMGIFIDNHAAQPTKKKALFIVTILIDFSMLVLFKYTNFIIRNILGLYQLINAPIKLSLLDFALPLGISFYTFQIVSYIIDIYRGKIKANHSLIELGTYISMFPQLIAGPIVMYSDINASLKSRVVSMTRLDEGLKIFIVGLGYKVILANRIGILWNEIQTIGFLSISTPLAWLGALAYSLQLYFDFCGYSYMAIGLGKILGFEMPQNFNHPYESRSVTDFWRRWHITLGTWFKEYVYIPLGGNRKGKNRMFFNLFVVWFCVGLWHGADWNFVIWGLLIWIFQMIEKAGFLHFLQKNTWYSQILSHVYIIFYILISWVVFAISDFHELAIYLCRMFPFIEHFTTTVVTHNINANDYLLSLESYGLLLVIGIILSTSLPAKCIGQIKDKKIWSIISPILSLAIFWYAVYFLALGISNPFLYFRF